jgi:hypothetical protein
MGLLRIVFYGSGTIFLPAALPRKLHAAPPRMSRSRDDKDVGVAPEGAVGPSEQNCNTSPQICGGRPAMAVTALTIHDIVISPRFPPPLFCSKAFRFQHKRCSLAGSIDQNLSHFCLSRRCAMISTWSEWKRYPRPGRGENIEAPITPGLYEVRYAGTGALHSFEAVDNVAQALAQLSVGSKSWFGRRDSAKLPDLEYRTCATSSKADAKAAAQRMIGRRETYMSGAA